MKTKIFILFAALFFAAAINAQEARKMYIMKNGEVTHIIAVSDVDSIIFDETKIPTIKIQSNAEQGQLLELGNPFVFDYVTNSEVSQATWTLEILTKDKEILSSNEESLSINIADLSVIPYQDNYYERTDDGMLRAQVLLTGLFANGKSFKTNYAVSLPYKPEKPSVQVVSIKEHIEIWSSDVTLSFSSFSSGNVRYKITIQVLGSSIVSNYFVPEGQTTYFLQGLLLDFGYEIKVSAINQYGESENAVINLGGDPYYYCKLGSEESFCDE